MAAKKGFEEFKPIFGEAMAEQDSGPVAGPSVLHRPFLFYVHALDPCRLEIGATDFCSHALECVLTVQDVEDLRDETGVGRSCSEFVDYLVASLSSDNVKLVVGGITKLVAHKSKGMPRVALSLNKLVGSSANDVMGNLSLALYRSFKEKRGEVVKEQLRCLQLEKLLRFEKEKTECLQKQLDSNSFRRKTSRPKSSDKAVTVSELSNIEPLVNSEVQQPSGYFFNPRLIYGDTAHVDREVLQGTLNVIGRLAMNEDSRMKAELEMDPYRMKTGTYANSQVQYAVGKVTPDLPQSKVGLLKNVPTAEPPTDQGTSSMKASQRVAPAYRRPKVRGARLQDTEDNDDA